MIGATYLVKGYVNARRWNMKLKSITLQNFRGIEKLTIVLDEKTTVFFGINGVGKSTILRAVDLIYANIIAKLIGTGKKRSTELDYDDISYGKSKANIEAVFSFEDGAEMKYSRSIDRATGKKHNIAELKLLVEKFEDSYLVKGHDDGNGNWIEEIDNKNMPVFVNYGVNRIVLDVPVRASKEQFVKLDAFDKAIESTIDFRNLFKWFRNQEDIENQAKVRENSKYEDKSLSAVKQAMLAMLDGFEDIHIDRKPLAMKVRKDGKYLTINQLSDGEKCTIALFGDLARRMALANPERENPLEGIGVVLIDELDLHMHTSWQRKVLSVLKKTFPNIQFIITTHSPQILGEVDDTFKLFYMFKEGQKIALKSYKSFMGWDTNVNQDIKRMLDEMYLLIEKKKFDEAEKLAGILDEKSNGYAEGVAKARILISRGRRHEKNK